MDCHTARLLADPALVQLCVDVMAVLVFHANDGDTVRLTIDHDEVLLVRGEGDGGRVGRRCDRLIRVQSNAVKATGMEYTDENDPGERKQRPRLDPIPSLAGACSGTGDCRTS